MEQAHLLGQACWFEAFCWNWTVHLFLCSVRTLTRTDCLKPTSGFAVRMMFAIGSRRSWSEGSIINGRIEQRIDKVVAWCGWVYSTILNLSKCGLRHDEIAKLTLRYVDLENRRVNVPTSKRGAQYTRFSLRNNVQIFYETMFIEGR